MVGLGGEAARRWVVGCSGFGAQYSILRIWNLRFSSRLEGTSQVLNPSHPLDPNRSSISLMEPLEEPCKDPCSEAEARA